MNKDERLRAAIHRASSGYYMTYADYLSHASEDAEILCEALMECRRRRDEISAANESNKRDAAYAKRNNSQLRAALAFIVKHGGMTHETECGEIQCTGFWCAEQARTALKQSNP